MQEHLIATAALSKRLNYIFKGKTAEAGALQEQIQKMYGDWSLQRIQEYLGIVAAPKSEGETDAQHILNAVAGQVSLAAIGFNVSSALAQFPQSMATFAPYTDTGSMIEALKALAGGGLDYAMSKSTVLQSRVARFETEYRKQAAEQAKGTPAKILAKVQEAGMFLQEFADSRTAALGWTAAYFKALKSGMPEAQARRWADIALNHAAPNMDAMEQSPLFRKGGAPKELIRFGSPLNTLWNQITYKTAEAIVNKNYKYVISLLVWVGIGNVIADAIKQQFTGDDDELKKKKIAAAFLTEGVTSAIPISPLMNGTSWMVDRLITGEKKSAPQQSNIFPMMSAPTNK
jgi:hypothetical protein